MIVQDTGETSRTDDDALFRMTHVPVCGLCFRCEGGGEALPKKEKAVAEEVLAENALDRQSA